MFNKNMYFSGNIIFLMTTSFNTGQTDQKTAFIDNLTPPSRTKRKSLLKITSRFGTTAGTAYLEESENPPVICISAGDKRIPKKVTYTW